jgi:ribosomal protein S18 acetylase RimI-like enzyme
MHAMQIDRLSAPVRKHKIRSRKAQLRASSQRRLHEESRMSAIRELSEIRLGDGRKVEIRSIDRSDLELERSFVTGLSLRTRYLRLLSGRGLLPGELERWTDIDRAREIALIAVSADGVAQEQVGVVRCARDDDAPPCWDFGIVVADAWQRVGLGEILLERLMARAEAAGIAALSSVTLPENRRMLALARRLGFTIRRERGDATLMRIERCLGARSDAPVPCRPAMLAA